MTTRLSSCPACMEHYFSQPLLVEACASVGISRGMSTQAMLAHYLRVFHRNGHRNEIDNDKGR